MLPQYNLPITSNKTIYINPNFKRQLATTEAAVDALHATSVIPSAHINPLFLERRKQQHRPTIHMNPAFLLKFQEQQQIQQGVIGVSRKTEEEIKPTNNQVAISPPKISIGNCTNTTEARKIICKSKNRLIREPLVKNLQNPPATIKPSISITQPPLLVLNKRKLIRKTVGILPTAVSTTTNIKSTNKVMVTASKSNRTKYKLDNRITKKKSLLPPTPKFKRSSSFVGRYALRRTTSLSLSQNMGDKKSSLVNSTINKRSLNIKLQLLNINGLLYKSTRNCLKLKNVVNTTTTSEEQSRKATKPIIGSTKKSIGSSSTKPSTGLTIFVRGTKYIMDSNKFKLTRATTSNNSSTMEQSSLSPNKTKTNLATANNASCRRRIDIGGYTFISANSAKNVFIRTTNHLSRAYVHNAKQKSLQLLSRRLVKTNIPCPIYQRVGKCAAFERGKCSKVHNKLQVAICSKFLRGECLNSKCLLSHNVSLSKMPVCKFFLQGVCVRNDCPYLHKKLSNNAEICIDFLRGFCQMADKCNKRHEFVCPDIERNIPCTTKNCIYCKSKLRKEKQLEEKLLVSIKLPKKDTNENADTSAATNSAESKENPTGLRYFIEPCDNVKNNDCDDDIQAMEDDNTKHDDDDDNEEEECAEEYIRQNRPKIGTLPAFIPL